MTPSREVTATGCFLANLSRSQAVNGVNWKENLSSSPFMQVKFWQLRPWFEQPHLPGARPRVCPICSPFLQSVALQHKPTSSPRKRGAKPKPKPAQQPDTAQAPSKTERLPLPTQICTENLPFYKWGLSPKCDFAAAAEPAGDAKGVCHRPLQTRFLCPALCPGRRTSRVFCLRCPVRFSQWSQQRRGWPGGDRAGG